MLTSEIDCAVKRRVGRELRIEGSQSDDWAAERKALEVVWVSASGMWGGVKTWYILYIQVTER